MDCESTWISYSTISAFHTIVTKPISYGGCAVDTSCDGTKDPYLSAMNTGGLQRDYSWFSTISSALTSSALSNYGNAGTEIMTANSIQNINAIWYQRPALHTCQMLQQVLQSV